MLQIKDFVKLCILHIHHNIYLASCELKGFYYRNRSKIKSTFTQNIFRPKHVELSA